jgi:hypothetical protein
MPFDMNNDYSSAGPGAKRRVERLTPDTIPKRISKPNRHQTPINAKSAEQGNRIKLTATGVKHRITLLTLQHEHYFDICDRLNKDGFGDLTKVLISHHRDMVRQVLKVIIAEGLITEKALSRYRADAQEAQRRRFKRQGLNVPKQ